MIEISSNEVLDKLKRTKKFEGANLTIKGDLNLQTFQSEAFRITLFSCTVEGAIQILVSNEEQVVFYASKCTFEGNIHVTCNTLLLNFSRCNLKGNFEIDSNKEVSILLTYCTTISLINLINLTLVHANFEGLQMQETEESSIEMFNTVIKDFVSFRKSILYNLSFTLVNFESGVSFSEATIKESNEFPSIFENVTFKTLDLEATVINKIEFYKCLFLKEVILGNAKCIEAKFQTSIFKESLTLAGFKSDALTFQQCIFEGIVDMRKAQTFYFDLADNYLLKPWIFNDIEIFKANRETYRIIKNEFLKVNNKIESLKYFAKEMNAYESELTFMKHRSEYIVMLANKVSNAHGLSWLRGVAFTLIITFTLFSLYLLTLHNSPVHFGWLGWSNFRAAINEYFIYFFQFILPTHYLNFMDKCKPTAFSYLIDVFSRVLIGYGIYQTIAAFRKYGKSE